MLPLHTIPYIYMRTPHWGARFRNVSSSLFPRENECLFCPFCNCPLLHMVRINSIRYIIVVFLPLCICSFWYCAKLWLWIHDLHISKHCSTLCSYCFSYCVHIVQKRGPCISSEPLMGVCSDKSRVGGFLRVICVPSMAHFASVLFNNTPVIE